MRCTAKQASLLDCLVYNGQEFVSEPFFPVSMVALGLALAVFVMLADAFCRPFVTGRGGLRSARGIGVLLAATGALFGAALVATGALATSAALVAAVAALITLVSNIKNRVLGEPLVFSDFALIGAVFQHPHFYVAALRGWQIALILGGAAALAAVIVAFSSAALMPRGMGLGVMVTSGVLLALMLRSPIWAPLHEKPDIARDVMAHGLVAALLVHWSGWRIQADPLPCEAQPIAATIDPVVIIVQCESFTDPADLLAGETFEMPGLAAARALAHQSGRLLVPGFGAYTMRTEYGVLFGRNEQELALRKFDPFLTAARETSYALPRRLCPKTWTSLFVHPHDLRFYGRDRLMAKAGFDRLIGSEAFAEPPPGAGRYVSDAAVADAIIDLASKTSAPTMIYAVTIENHGPWPVAKDAATSAVDAPYLRLVRNSDAMLARLTEFVRTLGRPSVLCFFGDHRPSIPGLSEPSDTRHTPYVIMSFGADGTPLPGESREADLPPSGLHRALLDVICQAASGTRQG